MAAGLTFSPNVSGQKNPALDAVGCMSQLVPVMDYLGNSSAGKEPLNETIKAISPSALSPFVEWELNTDWKGAPIERRGDWNENSPAWQRAYKGITYSNVDIRKTVVVIGWTTSKAEYMNSLSHEMLHVVQHISDYYLINMYGEEACYLLGGLVQATFFNSTKGASLE